MQAVFLLFKALWHRVLTLLNKMRSHSIRNTKKDDVLQNWEEHSSMSELLKSLIAQEVPVYLANKKYSEYFIVL